MNWEFGFKIDERKACNFVRVVLESQLCEIVTSRNQDRSFDFYINPGRFCQSEKQGLSIVKVNVIFILKIDKQINFVVLKIVSGL